MPLLNACGVGGGGGPAAQNGANEVSGGFDWKKAQGTSIKILQTPHPYQQSFQPLLEEFTALTGIQVQADLVAEADYFTKLNTELAGRTGAHDVFMTGAYFIWQYGPPGWMEDLNPWLQNSSATGPDYDFEDIYEGLRTSTRWDFKKGSPLGSGGQWAIPWGFETNVVAYNKKFFDRARHQARRDVRQLHPARQRPHRPVPEPLRRGVPRLEVVGVDPPRVHDPVLPRGRQGLHESRAASCRPR